MGLLAAIASVLLIGQSSVAPPTTTRQLSSAPPEAPVAPAPPAAPDRSRALVPRINPASWITTDDYPPRAMREMREGLVTAQLAIGTMGRALTCGIRVSSGHVDLDDETCRTILRRARFLPSLDSNGLPRIALWPIAVRWRIPGDEEDVRPDTQSAEATRYTGKPWLGMAAQGTSSLPGIQMPLPVPLTEPGELALISEYHPRNAPSPVGLFWVLRVDVDALGAVTRCAPTNGWDDPEFGRLLCQRYAERTRFSPALDVDGRAVASQIFASWSMAVAPAAPRVP